MVTMNYRTMRRLYEGYGPRQTCEHIRENLATGDLKSSDFCLADIAEAILGIEFATREGRPGHPPSTAFRERCLAEAGDGTDSTAFLDISGQILINAMMERFALVDAIASRMVRTIQTRLKDGETIPKVTWENTDDTGIDTDSVHEGMPYPRLGIGEAWINTPPPIKYGRIMPVTKEAAFFDRTGQVIEQAGMVGDYLGLKKEKLLMDVIVGFGGGAAPTFAAGGKWKYKGSEYALYNTSAVDWTTYFYINQITDVLTDHTDITAAMVKYSDLRDPSTREPISIRSPVTLMVPPALEQIANRIANAQELRYASGAETTIYDNPYKGTFAPVPSQYMLRRLIDKGTVAAADAAKYWLLGDFNRAFAWMEAFPITPATSPTNSPMEFEQDIIFEAKASMMGTPAVIAPQYVLRSTGAG